MDNSQDNKWDSYSTYPKGGYLNDLWIYSKRTLLPAEEVPMTNDGYGDWTERKPGSLSSRQCEANPGIEWASRNEITCRVDWPKERAGHAGLYDSGRHGIWIHGGEDYKGVAKQETTSSPNSSLRSSQASRLTIPTSARTGREVAMAFRP